MKKIILALILFISLSSIAQGATTDTLISKPTLSFYLNAKVKEENKLYIEVYQNPLDCTLTLLVRRGDIPDSVNICYSAILHMENSYLKIRYDLIPDGIKVIFFHWDPLSQSEKQYYIPIYFSKMGI